MKKLIVLTLPFFLLTAAFGQLNTKGNDISRQLTTDTIQKIDNPEEYIKKETIGGKLDFNKALEKEQSFLFLYDGVAYNKKDFAIFLWGKKVKLIGISSSKKASKLWEGINNRELSKSEKKALIKGFESNS